MLLALALFIGGWLIGYRLGQRAQTVVETAALEQQLHQPSGPRFMRLLLHNSQALAGMLALGILTGPLIGLFIALFGAMVGTQVGQWIAAGVEPGLIAVLLIPHGIVELPAACLATAVGLRGGMMFMHYLAHGRQPGPLERGQLMRWAILSMLLVIPAAILEAFVTPALARAWYSR
jgi:stage II sporulation protein M